MDDYPIRPVDAIDVRFTDRFWRPRIDTNHERTIPYCLAKCEEYGRIENFRVAAGQSDGMWTGRFGFNDSDLSKVIEGASACLMTRPDEALETRLDTLIDLITAAQEPYGYLHTLWTAGDNAPPHKQVVCSPGREDRWGRIDYAHQLYNLGRLYEAAAAHWRATEKTGLLGVSTKSAELVLSTFGEGKLDLPPGRQEIELGLVKLFRVTGDRRLLELAKFFLEARGRVGASRDRTWGPYSQDHEPVTEQSEAVGHAVRAGYQHAAMADIAALTGDVAYRDAVLRVWRDIVTRKMHRTGGVGARHEGESFGEAYELPNLTAYNETCAAIAQCHFNHRLFLLNGKAKYADVLERVLYNGMLSGVSYDGERFFYPNPLASDGGHERSPWFDCSCCPTNVCRFIPAIPGHAYAVRGREVFVNLFVAGSAKVALPDGSAVLEQRTDYPWDGGVVIRVTPSAGADAFTLRVRVPGWARGEALPGGLYRFGEEQAPEATFTLNQGQRRSVFDAVDADGYLSIDRRWSDGDELNLHFPMPVRRVFADQRVEADRGRVALQRGPLVYCVEHADVTEGEASEARVAGDARFELGENKALCGGVRTITWQNPGEQRTNTAIPYYAWAHRGPGEMEVWLKQSPAEAIASPPNAR